jgi:hypothetical protein
VLQSVSRSARAMSAVTCWFRQNASVVMAIAALTQVGTAIVIVVLTGRLARLTAASLEIANREWLANVHLKLHDSNGATRLHVFNLSRNGVQIDRIVMRDEQHGVSKTFEVDMPISGTQGDDSPDISPHIVELVREHLNQNYWQGPVTFQVALFVTGARALRLSEPPVTYIVTVRDGLIRERTRMHQAAAGTPTEAFDQP